MSSTPSTIYAFAGRLVALESARVDVPTEEGCGAVRVCGRLRVPLARLVGVVGFRSLLTRALALAKAENPPLEGVRVRDDGTLEGFEGSAAEDGVAVVAKLLELLVTFIGEPLTLRLVSDAWPDTSFTGMHDGTGVAS